MRVWLNISIMELRLKLRVNNQEIGKLVLIKVHKVEYSKEL